MSAEAGWSIGRAGVCVFVCVSMPGEEEDMTKKLAKENEELLELILLLEREKETTAQRNAQLTDRVEEFLDERAQQFVVVAAGGASSDGTQPAIAAGLPAGTSTSVGGTGGGAHRGESRLVSFSHA